METYLDHSNSKKPSFDSDGIIGNVNSFAKNVASTTTKVVSDIASGENVVGVKANSSVEGNTTKRIESWTTKIPSAAFLGLALGSIALSASFRLQGRKNDAQFVGQWVSPILIMGLYNKLVKLQGSE